MACLINPDNSKQNWRLKFYGYIKCERHGIRPGFFGYCFCGRRVTHHKYTGESNYKAKCDALLKIIETNYFKLNLSCPIDYSNICKNTNIYLLTSPLTNVPDVGEPFRKSNSIAFRIYPFVY